MWNEKSQTTMFKGTHKWLPHKMDINIEIHLSCKYMDITREILIKKTPPNNIGPTRSQQHQVTLSGHDQQTQNK